MFCRRALQNAARVTKEIASVSAHSITALGHHFQSLHSIKSWGTLVWKRGWGGRKGGTVGHEKHIWYKWKYKYQIWWCKCSCLVVRGKINSNQPWSCTGELRSYPNIAKSAHRKSLEGKIQLLMKQWGKFCLGFPTVETCITESLLDRHQQYQQQTERPSVPAPGYKRLNYICLKSGRKVVNNQQSNRQYFKANKKCCHLWL